MNALFGGRERREWRNRRSGEQRCSWKIGDVARNTVQA